MGKQTTRFWSSARNCKLKRKKLAFASFVSRVFFPLKWGETGIENEGRRKERTMRRKKREAGRGGERGGGRVVGESKREWVSERGWVAMQLGCEGGEGVSKGEVARNGKADKRDEERCAQA